MQTNLIRIIVLKIKTIIELLKLNNNLKEIESFFDNHVIVKHKKLHGFIYFLTYTSFIIYNVPFIFILYLHFFILFLLCYLRFYSNFHS